MDKYSKTILLVEDEVLIAMAEEKQLTSAGYNVITAFNGEDAIEIAVKGESKIDLILMDIDLGRGLDGTQAAMEILNHKEIPVLFQSSHTEKEVVEKTEKITSYGYVVKHSGITILDASIKMAFKLHKAYTELKEKEENLLIKDRAIESSINAIAISDPGGKLIYVNPSFVKLWGFDSSDEIIGRDSSSLMKPGIKNETACTTIFSSGTWQGEMLALRKDNTVFDVEASASEIFSQGNKPLGMIAAFQDITERKNSEAKIKESRESYRVLVENIDSLVCEVDSMGRYSYLSPAYKKVTGYEPEELLGLPVVDQLHPDEFQRWRERCCRSITPDLTMRDTWRFRIKSGEWRWMDCSVTFFEKTPGNIRSVVISNDITERINEEKRMERIILENAAYLEELQSRVINNSIIIGSFIDFLKSRFADDASKKIFLHAESRIRFCIGLYQKFQARPEPSGINLYEYVTDVISSIPDINEKNYKTIEVSKSLQCVMIKLIWVLPLGLILNELITNALRFAYPVSGAGRVSVSHRMKGDKIELCVADYGIGFSETSNSSNNMGLSLVRKFVADINGELDIQNGSGTRVFITFTP